MNRPLIWIIAGTSVLGLGVPAFAAARSGSPDDSGVPGAVRGNCDEAEHATDPDCLGVVMPGSTSGQVLVTLPSTVPSTTATSSTTPSTMPSSMPSTPPVPSTSGSDPGATAPGDLVPSGTVASNTLAGSVVGTPEDVSGPCDEVEHADDARCAGTVADDDAEHSGVDVSDDDDRDDSDGDSEQSGRSGSDDADHSGHDGSDDDGSGSGHGGDVD